VPGDVGAYVNVGVLCGDSKPGGVGSRRSVGSVQNKRYRPREHLVIVINLIAIDIHFQKHAVTGLPIQSALLNTWPVDTLDTS